MMKQISSLFIVLAIGFIPGILFSGNLEITKVGEWGTGLYRDVFVQDDYAYCAVEERGLDIIDIGNPSTPRKVGNIDIPGRVDGVIVIGNCVYLLERQSSRVQVVDVTNPSQPILKGVTFIFGDAKRIDVKGNYAYSVDSYSLRVIDTTNPFSPKPLAQYHIYGEANDVFVKGSYAYVAMGRYFTHEERGLLILDISNPGKPSHVKFYHTGYIEDAYSVYVSGNYAYLGLSKRMVVIDVSNPRDPAEVANLAGFFINIKGIHVNGSYAYLLAGGLRTIDVSDPTSPTLIGGYETNRANSALYFSDGYVYLAAGYSGLQIVDVSDPYWPTREGYYDNSGHALNLDVNGNYVYLAHDEGGLRVINISEPGSPKLIGGYGTSDYIYNVFISGHYAYVVDFWNGLEILDVSNPSSPELMSNYSLSMNTYKVYVSGNYAYVTSGEAGLSIIDISNPTSPNFVGAFNKGNTPNGIYVEGNLAYIAASSRGLQIVDVSNPVSPTMVGEYITSGYTNSVYVNGGYAYVTDFDYGLKIIDVSDPTSPTLVGIYHTLCLDVYVVDNYAYAACANDGVHVIDVSDPTSPTLVASYDTPENARSVKVKGNYIYVADGLNGKFFILEIYNPATTPQISLNRTNLTFASTSTDPGINTDSQSVFISNSGGGTLNWSVSVNQQWLNCSPSSGINNGEVLVSMDTTGLPAGAYFGTITITGTNAVNSPQTVTVALKVYEPGQTSVPFGIFATPLDSSTISGSIPVTGWVLDDIGVQSVGIFRKQGRSRVYIGDAVFVEGARPDVEQTYPGYPMNYQAGWGYMMLTNFLPNSGNGTFKIQAIATDIEGNQVTLGTKTIICDNASAVKPFGTIDTPTQGGTATGNNFVNFGWVLTPSPNIIPINGSTIQVWVDGVSLGNPVYNRYREDIAALFPGYNNSGGAGGYFYLDTTRYENGVHTISWSVTDDTGNTDGIGSRYFSILNGSQSAGRTAHSAQPTAQSVYYKTPDISIIPIDYSQPVRVKKGYNPEIEPQILYPGEDGMVNIRIRELERVEIYFNRVPSPRGLSEGTRGLAPLSNGNRFTNSHWTGFQVIGNQFRSLPIGSGFDPSKGIFSWLPGIGFVGDYNLVFIETDQHGNKTKKKVLITINAKISEPD